MKIFYFTQEDNSNMALWQKIHFYDELSYHGIEIYDFNANICECWDKANEEALKQLRSGEFDVFLTAFCNKDQLFIETLKDIKSIGIPSICIRFDNLLIPFYDKKLAPYFDLVWLTSIETKYLYDKWGVNTVFAPYAANPYFFNYSKQAFYNRSVCFIGTPYGSRSRMMNTLTKGGVPLSVYFGRNNNSHNQTVKKGSPQLPDFSYAFWRIFADRMRIKEGRRLIKGTIVNKMKGNVELDKNSKFSHFPSVPFEQMSELYSKYALSLASTSAVHTDILKEPLKVINLRNFEIPMSGGIEICRYNPELADYFEENKEILFYRTNEELIDKANYYTLKAQDSEIGNIKQAARVRAENEHTWYQRFKKVFRSVDIKI